MRHRTRPTDPSCHCHFNVATDGTTFRSIYGMTKAEALSDWRKLVQPWIDSGLTQRHKLFDDYLRNPRPQFVRCPTCSN